MLRRYLKLLLSALLVFTMVTACTSSSSNSDDDTSETTGERSDDESSEDEEESDEDEESDEEEDTEDSSDKENFENLEVIASVNDDLSYTFEKDTIKKLYDDEDTPYQREKMTVTNNSSSKIYSTNGWLKASLTGKDKAGETFTDDPQYIGNGSPSVFQTGADIDEGAYLPREFLNVAISEGGGGEGNFVFSTVDYNQTIACLRPGETRTYYFWIELPEDDEERSDCSYTDFTFYYQSIHSTDRDLEDLKLAADGDLVCNDVTYYEMGDANPVSGTTMRKVKGSVTNNTGHYISHAALVMTTSGKDADQTEVVIPISNLDPGQTKKFDTEAYSHYWQSFGKLNKKCKEAYYIIDEDQEKS